MGGAILVIAGTLVFLQQDNPGHDRGGHQQAGQHQRTEVVVLALVLVSWPGCSTCNGAT